MAASAVIFSFLFAALIVSSTNLILCSLSVLYATILWIYTKKVDKYDKIEDKQRRNKNDRKEKQ